MLRCRPQGTKDARQQDGPDVQLKSVDKSSSHLRQERNNERNTQRGRRGGRDTDAPRPLLMFWRDAQRRQSFGERANAAVPQGHGASCTVPCRLRWQRSNERGRCLEQGRKEWRGGANRPLHLATLPLLPRPAGYMQLCSERRKQPACKAVVPTAILHRRCIIILLLVDPSVRPPGKHSNKAARPSNKPPILLLLTTLHELSQK
mmetsp:Transcript_2296/g.7262  ORF Transcript_2296/g.7262 Transcript_2296/m.7262 type:complete len:204 (-) Transcript_2296:870-1481(-)